MDVAHSEPGKALNRDITQGEQVDGDIQRFIETRHAKRGKEAGRDGAEEMAWKESVRVYNAAREDERRNAWCEYHQEQAERHRAVLADLVRHYEQQAQKLGGGRRL